MAGKGKSKSAAKANERGEARQPPPETHVQELDALRARYEKAVKELDDLLLQKHTAQLAKLTPPEPTSPEPTSPGSIGWNHLPAEVRVEIYKHCFKGAILYLDDNGIDVTSSKASSKSAGQIARVSKQIHHESEPLLYCATTLVFNGATQGPAKPNLFRRHITKNLKYIKCITVNTESPVALTHRDLRRYSGLEVLRFEFRSLSMRPGRPAGFTQNAHEIVRDNNLLTRYILEQMSDLWDLRNAGKRWNAPINYDALARLYDAKNRTYKIELAIAVIAMASAGHPATKTEAVISTV